MTTDRPSWRQAWAAALYGPDGFYRLSAPIDHFSTAAHGPTGAVLAVALWRHATHLGATRVVDFAAGRGELAEHLLATRPAGGSVAAMDLVPRPAALSEAIGWWQVAPEATIADPPAPLHHCFPSGSKGVAGVPGEVPGEDLREAMTAACAGEPTLVVAHEWLDVVPCTVAGIDQHGDWVELDADLRPGGPLDPADLSWMGRWWPTTGRPALGPGARIEVGRARDDAWARLVGACPAGTALLAIDYGHIRDERPAAPTLTGYRDGHQVDPALDGTCDVTAHVAVDSLRQHSRRRQREALGALGVSGHPPDNALARTDPVGYLHALAAASEAELLTRPGGFGDFWWVETTA